MTNPHTPVPSSQDRYPGMQRVRAGDHYPAGLKFQSAEGYQYGSDGPPQAAEPPAAGRCDFELIVRGSCLDDPKAREAIRKAVGRAMESFLAQEAQVQVGAVVMKS